MVKSEKRRGARFSYFVLVYKVSAGIVGATPYFYIYDNFFIVTLALYSPIVRGLCHTSKKYYFYVIVKEVEHLKTRR